MCVYFVCVCVSDTQGNYASETLSSSFEDACKGSSVLSLCLNVIRKMKNASSSEMVELSFLVLFSAPGGQGTSVF